MLIVLQWNARSLISNGQEFKKFISDMGNKPHIICIQETWLKPQLDFVIQGYTAFRNDREQGQGGGVATFVQNKMKFELVSLGQECESIVIKVWTGNGQISVINYYNPCKRLSINSLNAISEQVQCKVIWCGDFNSHSTLWGAKSTDANGRIVEEFLEINRLVCINDGSGTRYDCNRNTESSIDLTLVSSEVAGITDWEVSRKVSMGSDHFPIVIKIGMEVVKEVEKGVPRWRLDKANWELFQVLIQDKCNKISQECIADEEYFNKKLTTSIIQAAEIAIPRAVGRKDKKSVPWWGVECRNAVKKRNKMFKLLRKHHSLEALIEYKRAQAVVRKNVRAAKRGYWRQYCNTIGRETKLSEIWGMIRKMSGIRKNNTMSILKNKDHVAISNNEKAELLAKTLVKVHSSENLSDIAKCSRDRTQAQNPLVTTRRKVTNEYLNMPFTMFELKKAIAKARQSTPGKDGICYLMLAHMSDKSLEVVLKLFNLVWETGRIPSLWKQSVIIPILKPGKDATDPLNYRPIALTSQLGKTMERMVTDRLTYFLESKNLFCP